MSSVDRRRLRIYLCWVTALGGIGYLVFGMDAVRVAIWCVIVYPILAFAWWFVRSPDRFHGGDAP